MEASRQDRTSIGVIVFAVAATVLGWFSMGDVGFRDSGELGSAAYGLGVAHPTGFAIDLLWLRLSGLLPLGHLAFRQNLFTALVAAAALGVLAQLCSELARRAGAGAGAPIGAVLAAVGLGNWGTFFVSARAVEVYASALLAVLAVGLGLLRGRAGVGPALLLVGLSPGLHVTAGLYAATLTVGHALAARVGWRALRARGPLLCVGALVIAYLPLASLRQPPLDWGDPETPGALWAHLTAARIRGAYQGEMLSSDGLTTTLIVEQLLALWPLALLALFGVVACWRRVRGPALAGALLFAADLAYAAWLNPMGAVDRQVGHVAGAMLALAGGVGAAVLVARLRERGMPAVHGWVLGTAIVLGLLLRFDTSLARDGHAAGELFGSGGPLAQLPPRALLVCNSDDACAAGLFALYVEGVRPDVDVAPSQHLWDHTVLRRVEGMEALGHGPVPAHLRGDAAAARARRLALESWPRPILWEGARPLTRLGFPGEIAAAPTVPYVVPRPLGEPRGWTPGLVARLDTLRAARLPGGRASEPWARDAWARSYGELGQRALMTQGTMEGVRALRIATELAPERAAGWTNLGVALETVADLRGAMAATREAVSLEPRRPTPWVNLARLQLKSGDRTAALRVLELATAAGIRDTRLDGLRREIHEPAAQLPGR